MSWSSLSDRTLPSSVEEEEPSAPSLGMGGLRTLFVMSASVGAAMQVGRLPAPGERHTQQPHGAAQGGGHRGPHESTHEPHSAAGATHHPGAPPDDAE